MIADLSPINGISGSTPKDPNSPEFLALEKSLEILSAFLEMST
jgi:hypothetical protein